TGWVVKDVRWGGVRFHDLLAAARPQSKARALHFVSAEKPYEDFLDLRQVSLRDVMLAYEMDGNKNVKWVERIDLVARAGDGYWEQRGYDRDAWVGRSNGYG